MASNSGPTPTGSGSAPVTVQNVDIRVPKNHNKKLAIMRFNASIGVEFTKWVSPKMERENNQVQFRGWNEDAPEFGAGSEYGRKQREEARRRKYGMMGKKYNPENQPWILQHGPKTALKKFRGVREGGVASNASYYVLTQAADGAFEAFPVQEWYNFQSVQTYKALNYEEAEEAFSSRNSTFNKFNVMLRKRMKKEVDEEDDGEEEGEGKGKGNKKKKGKESRLDDDMDELMESSAESSDDDNDEGDGDDEKKSKKKGKKGAKPKKKRKNDSDNEAGEDSDDGDGEGRELDYISSSEAESEADVDTKEDAGLRGVAEEDALRKLLNSDEEDEEEEKVDENKDDENDENASDDEPKMDKGKDEKDDKKKKKKKKNKDKKPRKEDYGSSSDSDGDSSSSEMEKLKPSPKPKSGSANSSRSATPTKPLVTSAAEVPSDSKRSKPATEAAAGQPAKKPRLDAPASTSGSSVPASASASSSSANEGVTEESVRRYLQRKPMTTTELLQKFKSKRTGLTSEQLVPHIAQILKKINPVKQTIKGKMYLSIKN